MVDSLGNELLSTAQKKQQYPFDNTPGKLTSSQFFYFGKVSTLRLGDFYYSLSKEKTMKPEFYCLAILEKEVALLLEDNKNLYLQLRKKTRNRYMLLAEEKLDLSDFHQGCNSSQHWYDEKIMNQIKVVIR